MDDDLWLHTNIQHYFSHKFLQISAYHELYKRRRFNWW